jgi:hypothetical protein
MCLKCQEILLPLSEGDDWEEAQMEWHPSVSGERVDKCICGVNIIHQYPIRNILTGASRVLGCICIITHKTFEHNHNLVKHVKDSLKFYCKVCDKKVTNKELHLQSVKHILAQDLLDIKRDFFKCDDCKQYNIRKPSKYKVCWPCHVKKFRKCMKCHKYIIKRETTYKMCYKCKHNK